jgi:hypothetical protein
MAEICSIYAKTATTEKPIRDVSGATATNKASRSVDRQRDRFPMQRSAAVASVAANTPAGEGEWC